jgi:hypothetical protein
VTFVIRLAVAVLAACALAGGSEASPPRYVQRDVAFVTVTGRGTVWSFPRGIACPGTCRGRFLHGSRVRLVATAAPGWKFLGFSSKWCPGARWSCAFDLASSHECDAGMCPVGAFGVRAAFARQT